MDGTRLQEAVQDIRDSAPDGLHPKVRGVQGSVTSYDKVDRWVERVREKRGRIDGLVNNAGMSLMSKLTLRLTHVNCATTLTDYAQALFMFDRLWMSLMANGTG